MQNQKGNIVATKIDIRAQLTTMHLGLRESRHLNKLDEFLPNKHFPFHANNTRLAGALRVNLN